MNRMLLYLQVKFWHTIKLIIEFIGKKIFKTNKYVIHIFLAVWSTVYDYKIQNFEQSICVFNMILKIRNQIYFHNRTNRWICVTERGVFSAR